MYKCKYVCRHIYIYMCVCMCKFHPSSGHEVSEME